MGAMKSLALRWQDATGNRRLPTNAELDEYRAQLASYDAMMAEMVEQDRRDWEIRDDPRMAQVYPGWCDDQREVR